MNVKVEPRKTVWRVKFRMIETATGAQFADGKVEVNATGLRDAMETAKVALEVYFPLGLPPCVIEMDARELGVRGFIDYAWRFIAGQPKAVK